MLSRLLYVDAFLQDRWCISYRPQSFSPSTDRLLDITIELADGRPDAEMQLKVTADTKEKKYEIRKSKERIIRRVSDERMYVHSLTDYLDANVCDSPCDETKEIVIQLYEYRRKYGVVKDKVQVFSKTMSLRDDEVYREEIYHSEWSFRWAVSMLTTIQATTIGRPSH